jgi:transposase
MKIVLENNYIPHIKQRREEADAKKNEGFKPRRWVVERTNSWTNRFRKLATSYEKTLPAFFALHLFAAALIAWRETIFIYG